MKAILAIVLLALTFITTSVNAKDLKIGVLDFARVLEESPQAEKARQAMQDEFAPREKEMIDLQKKIRDMEERFARDAAIMSESERSRLDRDILAEKRDFKRKQDEFRDDINLKRNDLLENLQKKLITSVRAYAKSKNFDLLLADGVIYTSDALNVTEEVLEQLKKDAK